MLWVLAYALAFFFPNRWGHSCSMIVKHNVICKRLLSKQYAPNVIVGELLDGREKAFLVGKACSYGLPKLFSFILNAFFFIYK